MAKHGKKESAMNKNESKYFNTVLKMDEALLTLLEKKDFDFITVKEICVVANVNRSTFYLHYENTYDLLSETISVLSERFAESFRKSDFPQKIGSVQTHELYLITDEYLFPYLAFVLQNKKAFRAICSRPDLFDAEKSYKTMFDDVFSPILSRFGVPEEEHEYRMEFYTKGVSAIVMRWVARDCIEPIEKIASIVKNCVGHAESGKPAEKLPQQSPPDSQT